MKLTTNQTVATTGVTLGTAMTKENGSSNAEPAEESPKLGGNKLLTMVARFVALIKYRYITKRTYEKNSLKEKYK